MNRTVSILFACLGLVAFGCDNDVRPLDGGGDTPDTGSTPMVDSGTDSGLPPVTPCAPFMSGAECAAGEWCFPDPADADMGGCFAAGSAAAGAACEMLTDCVTDHGCVGGTCERLCDPDVSGQCGASEVCSRLAATDGTALAIGACLPGCTAWEPDATTAGCEAMEWCAPDGLTPDLGRCRDGTGTGADGAACGTGMPACAPGNFCLGAADGGATCSPVCKPGATAGMPGGDVCEGGEACFPLVRVADGVSLETGSCGPTCDYDAETACADSTRTCAPGELFESVPDRCINIASPLNEGDDCAAASLEAGATCGATSACLESAALGMTGVRCYELCRTTEGAIGSSAHPDCTRAAAVCTMIAADLPFGICGAAAGG